ncbi:MAG: DMT family transporter [Deltaproteobacteria bacterium]|nr:DMT family transporter [Deltaproteobacteria bacterium]
MGSTALTKHMSSLRKNQPVAGALYILGAGFMFAIMGALVRMVSTSLNNEMVVFFRNLFALIFMIPVLVTRRALPELKTENFSSHLIRTVTGLSAMYCYFYALAHMKLAEAVLLSYTTPLFIPLIALIWLKEPVPKMVRFAVIIGFAGVVLILRPGFGIFQPVSVIALIAAIFASTAMVTIRSMSDSEPPGRIVFYYTVLSTLISAIPLLWAWEMPQGSILPLLLLMGIVAVSGQLLMTRGYSAAPAAQVGPFIYATVVFASILGWIFWSEALDLLSLTGAILICIAGVTATRRTQ